MIIKVVGKKIMPAAAKELTKTVVAASVGAGVTDFILDRTVGPLLDKASAWGKGKIAAHGEKKKAKLEAKKEELLAQRNEIIEKNPEETKTTNKKSK